MDSSHSQQRRFLYDSTLEQSFNVLGSPEDTEEATDQVSPLNSLFFFGLVSGEIKPFCKLNEQSQQG